ncbi:MAG: hypothetical protein AVDCRST_MAG56-6238, partial [uncultured Cytophagales bacterium]
RYVGVPDFHSREPRQQRRPPARRIGQPDRGHQRQEHSGRRRFFRRKVQVPDEDDRRDSHGFAARPGDAAPQELRKGTRPPHPDQTPAKRRIQRKSIQVRRV